MTLIPKNGKFIDKVYHMTYLEKYVESSADADLICDLTELGKIHHLSGRMEPRLMMQRQEAEEP